MCYITKSKNERLAKQLPTGTLPRYLRMRSCGQVPSMKHIERLLVLDIPMHIIKRRLELAFNLNHSWTQDNVDGTIRGHSLFTLPFVHPSIHPFRAGFAVQFELFSSAQSTFVQTSLYISHTISLFFTPSSCNCKRSPPAMHPRRACNQFSMPSMGS